MDTRTKETVRYLGYRKHAIDEPTLSMIQESFLELEEIADVKSVYRIFEISHLNASTLKIGNMTVESKSLSKNLKGCNMAILFGVTLGTEVDRRLRKYEILNMPRAVIFQASASAFLEEHCDEIEDRLKREYGELEQYLRPRFSPGYGDFSILHQKDVLEMLEAPKRIGLTMTDSFMLIPAKSVTAVIGVSHTNEGCHKNGCEICSKTDCLYRRS